MTFSRAKFSQEGWIVGTGLVPAPVVDPLGEAIEQRLKPYRGELLRQSNLWEIHRQDADGHIENPLLQCHIPEMLPGLEDVAEQILAMGTQEELRRALTELMGGRAPRLVQSMLFDKSPATPPHQDGVYLDSLPPGHLIAAWIALEDIHPHSGPLYVLPKSRTPALPPADHESVYIRQTYMADIARAMEDHRQHCVTPALKKGDALFWRSDIIHGAHHPINPRLSRRALALHFVPEGYEFGNSLGDVRHPQFKTVNGMAVKMNPVGRP